MKIEITYGVGNAPLWHVSADPGQVWRLYIGNNNDKMSAFEQIDGNGIGQAPIPTAPATYYFWLLDAYGNPAGSVTYIVAAPPPPPPAPEPLPPPPPPGSGVSDTGRVGTSCSIMGQGSNGVFFYAIYHDRKGYLSSFHRMDWDEAKAQAERMASCFEAPPPPAPPITQPVIDEMKNQVINYLQPTLLQTETINGNTETLKYDTAKLNQKSDSILDLLKGGIPTLLGSISDFLSGKLDSASAKLDGAHGKLDGLKSWTDSFSWPSWNDVIVQPLKDAISPLGKVVTRIENFKWPDWDSVIVQPISRKIDEKVSSMFGIDVEKPFWDELETKIIRLGVKILAAAIITIFGSADDWKIRKV